MLYILNNVKSELYLNKKVCIIQYVTGKEIIYRWIAVSLLLLSSYFSIFPSRKSTKEIK